MNDFTDFGLEKRGWLERSDIEDGGNGRVDGMVTGGAGEPSAKRAKADEAKEEEDPLVRRKEELILGVENARAEAKRWEKSLVRDAEEVAKRLKRKADEEAERPNQEAERLKRQADEEFERVKRWAKAESEAMGERMVLQAKKSLAQHLPTVCVKLEAKNEKLLGRLLPELWGKILDEYLDQNDLLALAMTCRFFRDTTKDLGKKVVTDLYYGRLVKLLKRGKMTSHTLGWFQWVCDTWEILPGYEARCIKRVKGAVYEGNLVNYAAFQGSVKILSWVMEEKGWELNEETGKSAGRGGSVEVLEHMRGKGYKFDEGACNGAASEGHLEALKFLRGLDPPCRWDELTAEASVGHLDILKWARSQDPPCPWDGRTCQEAAKGGHLEVLKFLRAQNPPCPWSEMTCTYAAREGHLEILKFLRGLDPPCPWDEWTCYSAARGRHLDVLKFLRSQDPPCPWDGNTCSGVAEEGQLELLKWIHSEDPPCPWDEGTCYRAAKGGHLEVLKWARSQDPPCPWSRSECKFTASQNNHQHIINWIDLEEDESDVEYIYGEYCDRSYDSYGDDYF